MLMRIGVVGAGITGLTVAHVLQASGHDVAVFESHKGIGGLASVVSIGDSLVERYYHHFFMNDTDLLALLAELDLADTWSGTNLISATTMATGCTSSATRWIS